MTKIMLRRLRSSYYILIPCLLVAAYAIPIGGALLPSQGDDLTESYEPAKTLMFVYTHGTAFHKWGPVPSIIYAPFYAPFLGYWYSKGEFTKPVGSFLSAFSHPFEELGTLILVARCIGLLISIVAVGFYSRSIAVASRSKTAALVAMLLCVAMGPDLIYESVTTKPDGLMMAFLLFAMGMYGRILSEGFTVRRGTWLILAAVASVSCKEQAASAFAGMFAWILVSGFKRRQFALDYAKVLLIGIVAYGLINVVYAPSSWLQHIQYWTSGPGKDPAVWAPPGLTLAGYLGDALNGILFNLGPGGSFAVLAALIGSVFYRSKLIAGAWAPFFVYLIVVIGTAGNLPRYYLLPVTALSALPVALMFAQLQELWASRPQLRMVAFGCLFIAIGLSLWNANMAWADVRTRPEWMMENYAASHIAKDRSISLANPWKAPPGSSRLSYLGYRVDDRPLGVLMEQPGDLPDYVMISREWETWMAAFQKKPARAALYNGAGFSYTKFGGIQSLGYELQEVVHPGIPLFLQPQWFPWPPDRTRPNDDLMVYRKVSR